MKKLSASLSAVGVQISAVSDERAVLLPLALTPDIPAVTGITEYFESELEQTEVALHRRMSTFFIAGGKHAGALTESQLEELDRAGLAVAWKGHVHGCGTGADGSIPAEVCDIVCTRQGSPIATEASPEHPTGRSTPIPVHLHTPHLSPLYHDSVLHCGHHMGI